MLRRDSVKTKEELQLCHGLFFAPKSFNTQCGHLYQGAMPATGISRVLRLEILDIRGMDRTIFTVSFNGNFRGE